MSLGDTGAIDGPIDARAGSFASNRFPRLVPDSRDNLSRPGKTRHDLGKSEQRISGKRGEDKM